MPVPYAPIPVALPPYSDSSLLVVENNMAEPKTPAIIINTKNTIQVIAKNLAHFAASVRCAFVTGSMDKEKSEVFVCSINSWFWFY